MGLRVLLPHPPTPQRNAALQVQNTVRQVEVAPPDRTQLTATQTGDRRQPHKRAQLRVLPRAALMMRAACAGVGGQDSTFAWPAGPPGRSGCPRSRQGTARRNAPLKMKWDLPDRRCREPHAGMRPATLVALVCPRSSVIDTVPLAVTMVTAVPQLGLERVNTSASRAATLIDPIHGRTCRLTYPSSVLRVFDSVIDSRRWPSSSWPTVASARGSGARTPGMAERTDGASDNPVRPCGRQGCPSSLPLIICPRPTRRMFWHSRCTGGRLDTK
jgi:hypothetical protein